jgi:hypothetical protein
MELHLRIVHLGIAFAYVLAMFGVDHGAVSLVLACGHLLIAMAHWAPEGAAGSK